MSTVPKLLQSIGKTSFVEYFKDYKELVLSKEKLTKEDKMPLPRKLLQSHFVIGTDDKNQCNHKNFQK